MALPILNISQLPKTRSESTAFIDHIMQDCYGISIEQMDGSETKQPIMTDINVTFFAQFEAYNNEKQCPVLLEFLFITHDNLNDGYPCAFAIRVFEGNALLRDNISFFSLIPFDEAEQVLNWVNIYPSIIAPERG